MSTVQIIIELHKKHKNVRCLKQIIIKLHLEKKNVSCPNYILYNFF